MKPVITLSSFAICFLLLTACNTESEHTHDGTEYSSELFEVRGVFVALNQQDSYITVIHEEIPDVMNAMRMNINIEELALAENLERGDIISFNLERDGFSWFARSIAVLPEDTELDLPQNLQEMIKNL